MVQHSSSSEVLYVISEGATGDSTSEEGLKGNDVMAEGFY